MDNIETTKEENMTKIEANEVDDNTIYDCRWGMNFNGTNTPTSIDSSIISRIRRRAKNMADTATKTHEEILAGWDALIKKIEDDRYNYFWNKGYDDYLNRRQYREQVLDKDHGAYHNGWIEAQDKFTKDRR